jgi:5'-3' exonuclease
MSAGFLLIDGNHIGYAAASAPRLSIGTQDTQAVFGFIKKLRPIIARLPHLTPLVLWDGISWRKQTFPEYKASRGKVGTTKHEVEQKRIRTSFKSQRPFISRALKTLGVRQMIALNLEADDLAGLLVRKYAATKKIVMLSGDKDWIQLIRPTVTWLDPIEGVHLTHTTLEKRLGWCSVKKRMVCSKVSRDDLLGVPSPFAWLEMKALMGDKSDEIPGIGDIGDKGAIDFIHAYGSVGAFMNGTNFDHSIDLAKTPKKFRDLATDPDKHGIFVRNMMLMDLASTSIPKPMNLKIEAGVFDRENFEAMCRELLFKSILADLDGWVEPYQKVAA